MMEPLEEYFIPTIIAWTLLDRTVELDDDERHIWEKDQIPSPMESEDNDDTVSVNESLDVMVDKNEKLN